MITGRNVTNTYHPVGQYNKGVHSLCHLGSYKQKRAVKGTTLTASAAQNLPKPVQTNSLRKENGGQDIHIDLIRRGSGTGWGSALKSAAQALPSSVMPSSSNEKSAASLPLSLTFLVNYSDSGIAETSSPSGDAKSEASCHQVSKSSIPAYFQNCDENKIDKHKARQSSSGQIREIYHQSSHKHEALSFGDKLCLELKHSSEQPELHPYSEYYGPNQVHNKKQLMNTTYKGYMVSDGCFLNGKQMVAHSKVVESEPQAQAEIEQRIQEPLDSSLVQRKGSFRLFGLSRSSSSDVNDENVAPKKILIRKTSDLNVAPKTLNCSHAVELSQKEKFDHQVPVTTNIDGNNIALQLVDFKNEHGNCAGGEALTSLEQQKKVLQKVLLIKEEKNKSEGIATVSICETRQKSNVKVNLKHETGWSDDMARGGCLHPDKIGSSSVVGDVVEQGYNTQKISKLEQEKMNEDECAGPHENLTAPETKPATTHNPPSFPLQRGKDEFQFEASVLSESSLKCTRAQGSENEPSSFPDWSPSVAMFSFQVDSIWSATHSTGDWLRSPSTTSSVHEELLLQNRNGTLNIKSSNIFISPEDEQAHNGVASASPIVHNDKNSFSGCLKSSHRKFSHSNSYNKKRNRCVRHLKKK